MKILRIFIKCIYVLAWFLSPILFLYMLLKFGGLCIMYGCNGNPDEGVAIGIAAVFAYFIFLKLLKIAVLRICNREGINWHKEFWGINGTNNFFLYLLVIIIVLFSYFMGKANKGREYSVTLCTEINCNLS